MPAPSKAMRRAAAIAEHHPDQLYGRNKSMLGMTRKQLHEFASTKEKGLPEKVKKSAKGSGPFSMGQLMGGFKPMSAQVKIPGFKMGGGAKMPGFNSPGITGRLRPRAAFSNPKLAGGIGSPMSRFGSGPLEHADMKKGYKSMGSCKDYH